MLPDLTLFNHANQSIGDAVVGRDGFVGLAVSKAALNWTDEISRQIGVLSNYHYSQLLCVESES